MLVSEIVKEQGSALGLNSRRAVKDFYESIISGLQKKTLTANGFGQVDDLNALIHLAGVTKDYANPSTFTDFNIAENEALSNFLESRRKEAAKKPSAARTLKVSPTNKPLHKAVNDAASVLSDDKASKDALRDALSDLVTVYHLSSSTNKLPPITAEGFEAPTDLPKGYSLEAGAVLARHEDGSVSIAKAPDGKPKGKPGRPKKS